LLQPAAAQLDLERTPITERFPGIGRWMHAIRALPGYERTKPMHWNWGHWLETKALGLTMPYWLLSRADELIDRAWLDVRPKADIPSCTTHVRFRGKADMPWCNAYVCFW